MGAVLDYNRTTRVRVDVDGQLSRERPQEYLHRIDPRLQFVRQFNGTSDVFLVHDGHAERIFKGSANYYAVVAKEAAYLARLNAAKVKGIQQIIREYESDTYHGLLKEFITGEQLSTIPYSRELFYRIECLASDMWNCGLTLPDDFALRQIVVCGDQPYLVDLELCLEVSNKNWQETYDWNASRLNLLQFHWQAPPRRPRTP